MVAVFLNRRWLQFFEYFFSFTSSIELRITIPSIYCDLHGGGSSSSKGSTSTGSGGAFQRGVTGGRLEGGIDAWRDLTVLVMGTSDGLDFIAP